MYRLKQKSTKRTKLKHAQNILTISTFKIQIAFEYVPGLQSRYKAAMRTRELSRELARSGRCRRTAGGAGTVLMLHGRPVLSLWGWGKGTARLRTGDGRRPGYGSLREGPMARRA